MPDARTDERLLEAYGRRGDGAALVELVRRHARPLYGLAWHVLGDAHDAEDAVQEALVRLVEGARRYEPGRPARPWLQKVALNAALGVARSRRRRAAREEHGEPVALGRERPGGPGAPPAEAELAEHVRLAVAGLPDTFRLPIVLHYFQGLSTAEAAEVLGQPKGTVLSNLHRGREKLREALKGVGGALALLPASGLDLALRDVAAPNVPRSLASNIRTFTSSKAAAAGAAAKGGIAMKIVAGVVLVGALAGAAVTAASMGSRTERLPPPPFDFKWLPGWRIEHVAFTWGNAGKPLGGAARWAVNGGTVGACYPADHAESGRLYFVDKRRHIWLMDEGQIWLVAGTDDLGHANGPAEYAQFCGGGVYGGGIPGVVASGHTAYISDGGLRRIHRGADGRWKVDLVAGSGKKRSLAPGETASLADLAGVRQLAGDTKGNLYFVFAGGLARATPDGKVSVVITREKVNADLAAVYAKKWPGAKAPSISLGSGEGCNLIVHPDGSIYGGGRTWPSAWKVTPDGTFVPLVNCAPKDKVVRDKRWGPFEPAVYEPHCCMGWAVTPDGYVLMMNEIPWALSRCEFDKNQVTVMMPDGSFALEGKPWRPTASFGLLPDGSHACNAPGPFPSRSTWIRMRKEK